MARQSTIKTTNGNQTATTTMSSLLATTASLTFNSLQQLNKTGSAIGGHDTNGSGGSWLELSDSCRQEPKYQNSGATTTNSSTQFNHYNQDEDQDELYVKLSTFWYCFLAFVTAIGLLVSLVSNMIIIYLFTGTPSFRRNPSNIIAVNLSLSDLLYCIQWPSVIYCSLSQSTWMLEIDFVCKTLGFITVTTASASVLTVLAMSVERAIVIKYSIYAKSRYTIRSAWSIVVLIWLVSISSSLPPLFDKFNRFTLDPSKTSCTLDYLSGKTNFKLYMLLIYIIYWILPAMIITICYIFIIITFERSSKRLAAVGATPPLSWTSCPDNSAAAVPGLVEVKPSDDSRFWLVGRSRATLRANSREQIRWSSMLTAPLRRSSTTRLARGSAARGSAKMVAAKSSDNLLASGRNRMEPLTTDAQLRAARASKKVCRPPDPKDSSECNVSASGDLGPKACGRVGLERVGGPSECHTTRPNKSPAISCQEALDCHQSGKGQTRQQETSDENSPTTPASSSGLKVVAAESEINRVCGLKEQPPAPPVNWQPSGRCSSDILASNLPELAPLNARQVIPMNSPRPLWAQHGLDELDIARLHASRRCGQLDEGGGGNKIDDDSKSMAEDVAQAPRSRSVKLAIISRVMAQLKRASSFGQESTAATTATMSLTTSGGITQNKLTSADATAYCEHQTLSKPTPTTSHFGSSSSHSATRASMQIRLARMSFYLIVLWLISWTPIASLTLINLIVKCHLRANALVVFLANTMTKLGPTFDVFIYGISHPKIKKKFIQIIKKLLMLKNRTNETDRGESKFSVAANNFSFNSTFHRSHHRSIHRTSKLGVDKLRPSARRFCQPHSGVGSIQSERTLRQANALGRQTCPLIDHTEASPTRLARCT